MRIVLKSGKSFKVGAEPDPPYTSEHSKEATGLIDSMSNQPNGTTITGSLVRATKFGSNVYQITTLK